METYPALKILSSKKTGSSWPLLIDTAAGKYIVKLHGSGQGYGALVAEVVTAELAQKIELPVPTRALITIGEEIIDPDEDPELIHLLRASLGFNLGFEYIPGAELLNSGNKRAISDHNRAKILWLDWLTENPDRTEKNPNILIRNGDFWLIDHGAALGFQYNLANLTEDSPGRVWQYARSHIFYPQRGLISGVHDQYAGYYSYEEFLTLSWEIPHEFIRQADSGISFAGERRQRELFAAYLWKRLKSFDPVKFAGN